MTVINEYYWLLPHDPEENNPDEVVLLQNFFYKNILECSGPVLGESGFNLALCDILIPPDTEVLMAQMRSVFRVNVRFVKELGDGVFHRIHFEHHDWHLMMPHPEKHSFSIFFDSFRVSDPETRRLDENWPGRRHINILPSFPHRDMDDDVPAWSAGTPEEFKERLGDFNQIFSSTLSFSTL